MCAAQNVHLDNLQYEKEVFGIDKTLGLFPNSSHSGHLLPEVKTDNLTPGQPLIPAGPTGSTSL